MKKKNSRRQQLLRQYFLNAYSIAVLKQTGEEVASKVPSEAEIGGDSGMVPQAS
jgi:hypothetical protein